ncbi:M20/M25/M40 family metallo-hydrolase [Acinetobacter sp. ANC 3813]|uniref:M20/M25/M40 family metallo-hydrolase n=1 Tax=Acinetobacter sp. ANC 3813 TaxID=1977873 RepID=UPI000A34201F|nr:aminopeptidase [Acinetobacter sp. ANC 3813]
MKLIGSSILMLALCSAVSLSGCVSHSNLPAVQNTSVQPMKLDSSKMMIHLQSLQTIAQQHGGNRAVGSKGGLASAQYILNEAKKSGLQVQMIPFENRSKTVGQNIIVEIQGEYKDSAVIVGAHYDSVKMGPGINDNGTGVALVLELMHRLAAQKEKPKHTVYLAFWDSEEEGIAGSQAFAEKLTPEQLKGIKAYINVDMVGTKNPEILIADADKSSVNELETMLKERGMNKEDYQPLVDSLRSVPSHAGDQALEDQLKAFFKSKNLNIKEDVSTLTASDTAPFLGKVPVASIILFNEQMKGDELEFAPCYHKACDTLDGIDPKSLQIAADAVTYLFGVLNRE